MITTKRQLTNFMASRNKFGIKPGLGRIENLLQTMGHPEKELQAVHVAGTNGKGSVIQFMQEALVQSGSHVGVFTSPSFIGLTGHFLIDGIPADDEAIIKIVNQMIPSIQALDQKHDAPTAFEIITVIAFLYFKDKVDIALIETGMGGRFDTTNCFLPLVSVITSIAKDHMQYLGNTIAEIASHKAGIIKQETPVVTGRLCSDADKVIRCEAKVKNAPIYQLGKSFNHNKGIYNWNDEHITQVELQPGLEGAHQLDNAALALSTLHLLKQQGFKLSYSTIQKAFTNTALPGRFEQISVHPYIMLDSAHNMAGVDAFQETMKTIDNSPHKKLLFAGFKDKELETMLERLIPSFETVIATTFSHKRAAPVKAYRHFSLQGAILLEDVWQRAVDEMFKDPTREVHYYITGSMHFITMVRKYILEKK